MATADERYQEKIRARAENRVPVFVTEPVVDTTSNTPEAIEARYQAKLKRHGQTAPAAAPEAQVEAKPEADKRTPKPGKGRGEAPAAAPEAQVEEKPAR